MDFCRSEDEALSCLSRQPELVADAVFVKFFVSPSQVPKGFQLL